MKVTPKPTSELTVPLQAQRQVDVPATVTTPTQAPVDAALPPPPLHCEVLDALVAAKAEGRIKPAQQLAARNIKQLLDTILDVRKPDPTVPRNYFVGDIEGRVENQLQTLIDAGVIAVSEDGLHARFTDEAGPNARLVFLGDIGDRGPVAIRARNILRSLAAENPGRVDYTWGNRCLAKLGLLNDLPRLEQLEDKGYVAWLSKQHPESAGAALKTHNTLEARVQYWLEFHSAREQLDHHFTELSTLESHRASLEDVVGHAVTLHDAAQDYVSSLKPGGDYFEFLRMGNWGIDPDKVQGPVLAFHSGGSATSIKAVPNDLRVPQDAREWNTRWREMGTRLFAKVESELKAGRPVPAQILILGDSDYDDRAQKNSARSSSLVYGPRHRDKTGNYGAMSKEVAAFYAASGIQYEMVGHMPMPMPLLLKSDVGGVAKVYNDMSFVEDGSQAMVVTQGDLLVMAGRHGDDKTGELVFFSMKPQDHSPLGMVTQDGGYTVHSLSLDGRYNLMRVANGRQLDWKKVTPEELAALQPKTASLDEKTEITSEAWFASLGSDFHVHTPATLQGLLAHRLPVVVSGASSFGELPVTPSQMQALWDTLPAALGDGAAFITGGTNVEKPWKDADGKESVAKAPEAMLHALTGKAGMTTVGFVPEQTNTAILGPANLFVTGKKSQWGVPLQAGMSLAGDRGGAAVFVGGGATITRALQEALHHPKLHAFLVVGEDFAERVKSGAAGRGASEQTALDLVRSGALPGHFHLVGPGVDLGGQLAELARKRR